VRLALLFLLLPGLAVAGPRKVVLHVLTDFVLPAGSSVAATHYIHTCRQQFGIGGHCPDGGYGEFKARESIRFGFSVGMGQLSHYWRKSEDDRFHWDWLLPTAGATTWNTVTAIQAATHGGKVEKDPSNFRSLLRYKP